VIAAFLVVLVIGFNLVTFTVDETQNAVVIQIGEIQRVVLEPGLYFKTPFVQDIVYVEDRLLSVDIQPATSLSVEKKQLTVDSYTLWRIADPRLYVETVSGIRSVAETRIDDIIFGSLKDVIGTITFDEVLQRDFLAKVKSDAQAQVDILGIEIVDVRIKRADLPEATERAVFGRMISEREQIAQQFRAEGEQEALDIRSTANATVVITKAEGSKRAEELRGEGDAQALEIYADAYNQDVEFFLFWRTLESYKKTIAQNSTLVLTADSQYLKLFDIMNSGALTDALKK
jgi:membrane protease subunit HflC